MRRWWAAPLAPLAPLALLAALPAIAAIAADVPACRADPYILLARQVGVPALVVYMNKVDQVDDAEILELVELEIRELLSYYGFDEIGRASCRERVWR